MEKSLKKYVRCTKRGIGILLGTGGCFLIVGTAFAANRFWVGAANNSSAWENPANWSTLAKGAGGASVPGAADTAVFGASGNTVQIRSAAIIGGLSLQGTGTLLQGTGTLAVGTSGITVSSGSYVGGVGLLTTSGGFTQTKGSVTALQGTFALSGSLSITGASSTFASTGTIIFAGAADQNFTVGAGVTKTFSGITLENIGGGTSDDIVVNVSGGLNMSGTLIITLGNFDLATNDMALNLESDITIANAAQATFTTDANIIANGNVTVGAAGGFSAASSRLTLNGSTQSLSTNNATVDSLFIDSAVSTTLGSNQTVTTTLQVNTGATFSLGAYTVAATGATIYNYATISEGTGKLSHRPSFFISDSGFATQQAVISVGNLLYLTLVEGDENINGTAADTVFVLVSTSAGDSSGITLIETSNTSGVFHGSIDTVNAATSSGSSTLEANANFLAIARFTDAQDAIVTTDTADLQAVRGAGGHANRLVAVRDAQATASTSSSTDAGVQVDYRNTSVTPRSVTTKQEEKKLNRATQSLLRKKEEGQGGPSRSAVASPVREQATETFKTRVCDRVQRWFKGNSKMMERINSRLRGRFDFSCQE